MMYFTSLYLNQLYYGTYLNKINFNFRTSKKKKKNANVTGSYIITVNGY